MDSLIKNAFDAIPADARPACLDLRTLIFDVHKTTQDAGKLTEEVKWGQPSYRCTTGTPMRIGAVKSGDAALFCHCGTSLIGEFREMFAGEFGFEGNRALVLRSGVSDVREALAVCVVRGLMYRG